MSMLYVLIVLVAVFAMASLALDFGRVSLAKTQLRIATDYAAKYAVQWISGGSGMALAKANEVAGDNLVDGQAITYASGDVTVGHWNSQSRVFTPSARPLNAVKVTHTAAIPLALGKQIKMETSRVRSSSVATATPMGIVGFNGINFKNSAFAASYDPAITKNPTSSSSYDNVTLYSDGYIGEQNNGTVKGDCITGPSGSVDPTFNVSGGTSKLASAIARPADPAWNPSGNPGGIPQNNYNHSSNSPLLAGTYWFTGTLRVNAKLRFHGPTTIYINGDVVQNDDIDGFQQLPANLKIYQIGANRTWTTANNIGMKAQVIAPRSAFTANNSWSFYGACMFESITTRNTASFFFDETLGSVAGISIVQ